MLSKASDPDENLITDISLMVFDDKGNAEECLWLDDGQHECEMRLIKETKYTFCACANLGYQVYADDIEELDEIIYYMSYPDEYREGIPMAARVEVLVGDESEIHIGLERLMAKISLRMKDKHYAMNEDYWQNYCLR